MTKKTPNEGCILMFQLILFKQQTVTLEFLFIVSKLLIKSQCLI